MRQTNRDFRHYYRVANKLYFDNALPDDLPVRFGNLPPGVLGRTWVHGGVAVDIVISKRLQTLMCPTLMTLLHECLHVEKPKYVGHGWQFDKRMLQLAKLGAFNGTW
jgi:hypothetical protein